MNQTNIFVTPVSHLALLVVLLPLLPNGPPAHVAVAAPSTTAGAEKSRLQAV